MWSPEAWDLCAANVTTLMTSSHFTCGVCRGTAALSNDPADWCTYSDRWTSLRRTTAAYDRFTADEWSLQMVCLPPFSELL